MGAIFYFRKLERYYYWLHRRATWSTQIAIIFFLHSFPRKLHVSPRSSCSPSYKKISHDGFSAKKRKRQGWVNKISLPSGISWTVQGANVNILLSSTEFIGNCRLIKKASLPSNIFRRFKTISGYFNERVLCVTINFRQKKIKLALCR